MIIFALHLAQTIPDTLVGLGDLTTWSHFWQHFNASHLADWTLLAQQFETDVFADIRNWFSNFVQSGQIWAFLIGLILGYLLRSFTTYG